MSSEAPERVLFAPHFAEVEAVGVDGLQPSERAFAHQFARANEGRMILQEMADHEAAILALGELGELLRLGHVERQRLLDEDVLAGLRFPREPGVERRRRWDDDATDG